MLFVDRIKKNKLSFLLVISITFTVISLNQKFKERYFDKFFLEIFIINYDQFNIERNFQNILKNRHLSYYFGAVSIFKENIFFEGGFKNYRNICDKKKFLCSTDLHNVPLEILSSLGILSFVLFYFLFYVCYRAYLSQNLENKKNLILIYLFINFLFILPTGSIFNNYFSIISYYSLVVLIIILFYFYKKK